ncbi:MAG: PP2C family serine/threonine-protein phosphatase [Anaerolineae bacterium]
MSQIITGFCSESGNKTQRSDFSKALSFTRPNGDHISIALVADGGQNEKTGHMLAHIAVNSVITYLKQSVEASIPDLLKNAVQLSNRLVMNSFRSDSDTNRQFGCSLAIAIIINEKRLYIANVGGCQIYLVRDQNISKLTLDHNYKNVAALQGKMDYETAACNPRANDIVRSVGLAPDLEVDTGFHVGLKASEKAYQLAQLRGTQGLPLHLGDSIVVCSDGLGTANSRKMPLILDREMTQVLSSQMGNRGARGLVSFSLGRGAKDDVSVALLQYPDPYLDPLFIPPAKSFWKNGVLTVGGITAGFLTLCILAVFFFQGQSQAQAQPAVLNTENIAEQIAAINKGEVGGIMAKVQPETITAQPTPALSAPVKPITDELAQDTVAVAAEREEGDAKEVSSIDEMLRPTLAPKSVGIYRLGNERNYPVVWEDQAIIASKTAEIQINHVQTTEELIRKMEVLPDENTIRDASLYLLQGSSLEFSQVDDRVEFRIFEESDVLIETGRYTAGAAIEVRTQSEDVTFTVTDSCMSVVYSEEDQILFSYCFAGECQYKVGRWEAAIIPEGQRASFNPQNAPAPPLLTPITMNTAQLYRDGLLLNFFSGIEDTNTCLTPYINTMGMMAGGNGD